MAQNCFVYFSLDKSKCFAMDSARSDTQGRDPQGAQLLLLTPPYPEQQSCVLFLFKFSADPFLSSTLECVFCLLYTLVM